MPKFDARRLFMPTMPSHGSRRRGMRFLVPTLLLTAAVASSQPIAPAGAQARPDDQTLTIIVVGDVGLNSSKAWTETTSAIDRDISADINFMNLETVVTDRNDLAPDLKGQSRPFNFRMPADGLKFLVSHGFNLISFANNHSMDFGVPGLKETLRNVAAFRGKGVLAASGIGMNRDEACKTEVFKLKGSAIAFNATGIVTNNLERHLAGPDSPGQIAYRFDDDFRLVLQHLAETKAALRILSIHYGYEGKVRADAIELAQWRGEAAVGDGIDLIIGHHAHVVRGVEMAGRSLIFYGLGNFLHHGTANMTGNDICHNYGLMGRIHLRKGADGHFEIRAVEAIPVTDTHFKPRRLTGEQ